MTDKICVVGWHFFKDLYSKIEESFLNIYVVAHRYNKLLDDKKINYSVIKNVGLEFGAYDWYIKNVWDQKSSVLFSHDDMYIKKECNFESILLDCKNFDYVSFRNHAKTAGGGRCFYLSNRMIDLFVKEFGGIWFDVHDRGYVYGEKILYDSIYESKNNYNKIGKKFKLTIRHLIQKHNLKRKNIFSDKIELCVRGEKSSRGEKKKKYFDVKKLADNSIFGINKIEKIVNKREHNKWYNFYFSNIKMENLNILKMGDANKKSIKKWGRYFINSNIYTINNFEINIEGRQYRTFVTAKLNDKFLTNVYNEIPYGIDIVIDAGKYKRNRISNFKLLFKKLNPGGIYIVENLGEKYKKNDIVNYLKNKIDDINFNGSFKNDNYDEIVYKNNEKLGFFEKRIASIHFYFGICFVFKRYCK